MSAELNNGTEASPAVAPRPAEAVPMTGGLTFSLSNQGTNKPKMLSYLAVASGEYFLYYHSAGLSPEKQKVTSCSLLLLRV